MSSHAKREDYLVVENIDGIKSLKLQAKSECGNFKVINLPIIFIPTDCIYCESAIQSVRSVNFLIVRGDTDSISVIGSIKSEEVYNIARHIHKVALLGMIQCAVVIKYSEATGLILSRLVNLGNPDAVGSIEKCLEDERSCEWSSSVLYKGTSKSYDPFMGLTKDLFTIIEDRFVSKPNAVILEYIKGKINSIIVHTKG